MIENWRYNRALEAIEKQGSSESRNIFFEEEYRTQSALRELGVEDDKSPSEIPKVGRLLMRPEAIPSLRIPYAVEVLGMPHTGKTTLINLYLNELWRRNERNKVTFVEEGAKAAKKYLDTRESDPFTYSLLCGNMNFVGYLSALKDVKSGMRMVVSERGQIDRRIFRRALFSCGDVSPNVMKAEDEFMNNLENAPIQIGAVIILMARPQISFSRGKPGPVTNMEFLPKLYEQYWRLHKEILNGDLDWRVYACIDVEDDIDVYERFKYAMDTALYLHSTYLTALSQAFPKEYDKIVADLKKRIAKKSNTQQTINRMVGGNVLIVGGDDMELEEDIFNKPFIEGLDIRK